MNMVNYPRKSCATGRRLALAGAGAVALGAIIWSPYATAASGSGIADLVERVSPSVVTVFTTQAPPRMAQRPEFNFPKGSPFEEFFRRFGFPDGIPGQGGRTVERHALGSGFVLDRDGYIITNNHVVDGASEVKVRLGDKREFEARVIGTDPQTDIALLKIKASTALTPVTLGDSDKIRVGDDVIAVGNPFGLGGTVTRGIVSAIGRDINAGPYVDFIQTDAAINRGNSGGPLFDLDGRVIGVNSAIYSPNGGSVGVGFAIPSNIVKNVVAQLKQDGSVKRGWLGVSIQRVTPEIAAALGLSRPEGALVADVVTDGPSRGRLKAGDLILSYDGKAVNDSHDLPKLVASTKVGTTVDMKILRKGSEKTVSVKIGALKAKRQAANTNAAPNASASTSQQLGATLAAVTPQVREDLGLDDSVKGAVVTSLKADGAAARAGLEVGDVIVQIGNKRVTNVTAVDAAFAKVSTKSALVLINRHGNSLFLAVTLPA
jgi:serine protease Do